MNVFGIAAVIAKIAVPDVKLATGVNRERIGRITHASTQPLATPIALGQLKAADIGGNRHRVPFTVTAWKIDGHLERAAQRGPVRQIPAAAAAAGGAESRVASQRNVQHLITTPIKKPIAAVKERAFTI